MTQAFNLSQLANNTNTTGQINADTAIYNTVNVANGGTNLSATPANGQLPIGNGSGYSLATLSPGAGISITNGAGTITIAGGGVTSAVAGNGVAVSAATGAVTFSAAAPTFNSVGSYAFVRMNNPTTTSMTWASGSDYSVGTGKNQITSTSFMPVGQYTSSSSANNLSGTWRWLGNGDTRGNIGCCIFYLPCAIAVRVA